MPRSFMPSRKSDYSEYEIRAPKTYRLPPQLPPLPVCFRVMSMFYSCSPFMAAERRKICYRPPYSRRGFSVSAGRVHARKEIKQRHGYIPGNVTFQNNLIELHPRRRMHFDMP